MPRRRLPAPAALVALLTLGAPAAARAQSFGGTLDVTLPNFPRSVDPVRCGASATAVREDWPLLPGASAFGSFTLQTSNCADRTTGSHFAGLFTFDFGGGRTLFGTLVGQVALPLPPAVGVPTATSQTLTILGGTGSLAGAVGTLSKAGTITINADNTFTLRQTVTGTVSTVPEPATALLLAPGLLGVGAAVRRRRGARR